MQGISIRLPQAGTILLSAIVLVATTLALPPKPASALGLNGKVQNGKSYLCLATLNGSTAPNTPIIQSWCSQQRDDLFWEFNGVGISGKYQLSLRNTNQCVTPAGGATEAGTQLVLYHCFNVWPYRADQFWQFNQIGSNPDWHTLQARDIEDSQGRKMCAGVTNSSTAAGARVVLKICNGSFLDQQWKPNA